MFSGGDAVTYSVQPLDAIAARPGARRLLARPALVLLLSVSCWFSNKKPTTPSGVSVSQTEIVIRVKNHNFQDVVVYALVHDVRTRVGTVTGSSTAVFLMSTRLLGQGGEFQLLGDAIGSDEYAITERLIVQPGEYIDWTLESTLSRSTVSVY